MKLNADIVYNELPARYDAEYIGEHDKALHLLRPTFYMAPETRFRSDHLYVASADHLPAHPVVEKNVVIVCLGDSLQLSYYLKKCTVIRIRGKQDIFEVYLSIQDTFDRYDEWNDELFELFKADADVQKIISCSSRVFDEPVFVLDGDFRYIAATERPGSGLSELWKDRRENLSQYAIDHFLSGNELKITTHEPMFLKIVDANAFCINLFDSADNYVGCLCVLVTDAQPRLGLDATAIYLAHIVERSMEKNPALLVTERNARKSVLQDLVDGKPTRPSQQALLDMGDEAAFICVSLHPYSNSQTLPQRFILNSFEMAFPGSYALVKNDIVAGVIDLNEIGCSPEEYRAAVDSRLSSLTDSLKLYAGVSNDYSKLRDTPLYYKQAVHAFESGSLVDSQASQYYFMDYALSEMTINAFAGAPIETYFPYKFRELLKHDNASSVSFLETLKVVLAESMNYSKAADVLFIHRSTLIDRVNRIEEKYGINLQDSDARFFLQLLIKGIEIEREIRGSQQ